ncbi:MAG: type I 3-dehydroquinate dehydratase [Spirochaetaceae bacterium]|jgi:3-dehydroquinate dehydratase/shikimate dehydrogenase|nr:type I 3-dehydroquinate dehydratase [Spirochaetaceae bacterium]
MTKVCLCLTGKTLERDLEVLDKYRPYIDLVELRADCLLREEQFSIRRFPKLAGLPVILTIRRKRDGGQYSLGEGARLVIFSRALAFAEADVRHNFAYIDLEDDMEASALEEAARAFGTRIIRSFHSFEGAGSDLAGRIRSMYRAGDEIVKAAVGADSLDDVARLFRTSRELGGSEKILLCMGDNAVCTRILSKKLGSYLCYTTAKNEADFPAAAPGQLDPMELEEIYRFRSITKDAEVYGILGHPLKATSSPPFFNEVFGREKKDAVYIPFPSPSAAPFFNLADEIGLRGASVTVPHKETVLPHLASLSDEVRSVGACNTIIRDDNGWNGFNTDTGGFSASLLDFTGKKDFKGMRVTIAGAGGAARAVAFEIHRHRGRALILNRNEARAEQLASLYRFEHGGLDADGIRRMKKFSDIIVQTTSVGMEPDTEGDPLCGYRFTGSEVVMDIIYKPERTALLRRAAEAGCRVLNGADMLRRQAKLQYRLFFGRDYPDR